MTRCAVLAPVAAAVLVLSWPATARAQAPTQAPPAASVWSIEFYGGATTERQSASGSPIGDWPIGEPFVTLTDKPSRFVSSWRFGDGAALLNAALADAGALIGRPLPALVPLDEVLRSPGGRAGSGGMYGVRLSRQVATRWAVELSVERNTGGLTVDDRWASTLEAARAGFATTFGELFATAPVTGLTVESTLEGPGSSTSQTRILLALTRSLVERNRWTLLLTAGGGVQMASGTGAEVSLRGQYSMLAFNLGQLIERDDIRIMFREPSQAPVGLIGLGGRWTLTPSTVIRVDVRAQLTPNRVTTEIRTAPFNGATGGEPLSTQTTPGLQFSNLPSARATLDGQADATTLTTFTGSGVNRRIMATLGLVVRF
jgi:hypothetical protein